MDTKWIAALPIVRAMAILGVILVHATSFASIEMTQSPFFYGYTWFNIFFKFGTPVFIMLSSLVLFYNYGKKEMGAGKLIVFYRNRLKYILLPYAVASVCYFLLVQVTVRHDRDWTEAWGSFGKELITGSAYTHLYFVFISLQFYVLFPLLLKICQRPAVSPWIIPAGFLIQWVFVLGNKYEFHIVEKGSISLSYMGMYALGAYIGLHYGRIQPWLDSVCNPGIDRYSVYRRWNALLWSGWVLASLSHVQIWYITRSTGYEFNSLGYEALWCVHTALSAVVLLQTGHLFVRKLPQRSLNVLNRLGQLSFGIYLLHPLWLAGYRKLAWHQGNELLYALYIASGYVLALALSWVVVSWSFKHISWAWIALGSPPTNSKKTEKAHQTGSSKQTLER
ncbi:acyltransferase [Paenibacillus sp. ACRRX]|uniref:acyltransferase n=1 Tax=Paenibacillus sp. ACRRX TaxID=2918206 RepID=UPI001EF5963D|nr:acyltransferase [Paenibacillus sp. ACRRX]MCG7408841.1 acyltransferase [Paenibacillus sp. ACRRX]